MFTLYVLHGSHTDLGYTDTQEKMKAHHVSFIREALELTKRYPGFVWNCETYLGVENFLEQATEEEKKAFVQAVQAGSIGISGNYLNITDLIPLDVQNAVMDRYQAQWKALGLRVRSAMTTDIDGYGWGFSDVLYDHGITRLLSNLNPDHGASPLKYKQQPFWWETPKGNRVLAWSGEHYHLGNDLGIAMTKPSENIIRDGLSKKNLLQSERSDIRVAAYVKALQEDGYPYSFAPVCVSGDTKDNAPPSSAVLRFIQAFNQRNPEIQMKMATLDEFFDAVEQENIPIPTYRGDWTDWWSNGIGSTPDDVIEYRRAAYSYQLCKKADPDGTLGGKTHYAAAEQNMMLYGEHTWGHSASISDPCHPLVNHLRQWKRLYALKANESITIARERVQRALGETAVSMEREIRFRAVNVQDIPVQEMLAVDVEQFYGHQLFDVVDEATGQPVPFQLSRHSRGPQICIWLDMQPKETKTFVLKEKMPGAVRTTHRLVSQNVDRRDDLAWHWQERAQAGGASPFGMESPFMRIGFEPGRGIVSILEKRNGREWISSAGEYGAFTPIYEVTHPLAKESMVGVRRMGRNRKAFRTQRTAGELLDVQVMDDGPLFARMKLVYALPGTTECQVILTLYKLSPRLGVDFQLQKENVWAPENVYLSLPFEKGQEIWLDKAGALMRPRVDQLPFTCADFYAVQNGVGFLGENGSLLLASPDVPMISMGTLAAHPIRLSGEEGVEQEEVYSWVMNNFWETNFNACLAGNYSFHYDLLLTEEAQPQAAFERIRALNEGVFQFYRFDGPRCIPVGGGND